MPKQDDDQEYLEAVRADLVEFIQTHLQQMAPTLLQEEYKRALDAHAGQGTDPTPDIELAVERAVNSAHIYAAQLLGATQEVENRVAVAFQDDPGSEPQDDTDPTPPSTFH